MFIKIEDSIHSDSRFIKLAVLIKDGVKALGAVASAYFLARKWWGTADKLIPLNEWEKHIENHAELVEVGLARKEGDSVYVSGSKEQFSWILEKQEAGKAGGKASAKARKLKYGTAQPDNKSSKHLEAPSKQKQPDLDLRYNTKKNTIVHSGERTCTSDQLSQGSGTPLVEISIPPKLAPRLPSVFEEHYAAYPKRKGGQGKKDGLKICERHFTSQKMKDELRTAIDNYRKFCDKEKKTGGEFVMQFKKFVRNDWEEWLNPEPSKIGTIKLINLETYGK